MSSSKRSQHAEQTRTPEPTTQPRWGLERVPTCTKRRLREQHSHPADTQLLPPGGPAATEAPTPRQPQDGGPATGRRGLISRCHGDPPALGSEPSCCTRQAEPRWRPAVRRAAAKQVSGSGLGQAWTRSCPTPNASVTLDKSLHLPETHGTEGMRRTVPGRGCHRVIAVCRPPICTSCFRSFCLFDICVQSPCLAGAGRRRESGTVRQEKVSCDARRPRGSPLGHQCVPHWPSAKQTR